MLNMLFIFLQVTLTLTGWHNTIENGSVVVVNWNLPSDKALWENSDCSAILSTCTLFNFYCNILLCLFQSFVFYNNNFTFLFYFVKKVLESLCLIASFDICLQMHNSYFADRRTQEVSILLYSDTNLKSKIWFHKDMKYELNSGYKQLVRTNDDNMNLR